MFFDPVYFIFVGPAILLSLWASWKVRHSFKKWSEITLSRRTSGAEVARAILDRSGCPHV